MLQLMVLLIDSKLIENLGKQRIYGIRKVNVSLTSDRYSFSILTEGPVEVILENNE